MKCCDCMCSQTQYTSTECNEMEWTCLAGFSQEDVYDGDIDERLEVDEEDEIVGCSLTEEEIKYAYEHANDAFFDYAEGFCKYLDELERKEKQI